MSLITKRRLASLASASALIATVAVAASPGAALAAKPPRAAVTTQTATYFNGFEKATMPQCRGTTAGNRAMFNVTRVASGTRMGSRRRRAATYATAAAGHLRVHPVRRLQQHLPPTATRPRSTSTST